MIEKLDNANSTTLDFIQENINRKIFNKINEIIDYINHDNMGENYIKSSYETLQDKIEKLMKENNEKDTEINKLNNVIDRMAEKIEGDNRAINEEYAVDELFLDREKIKEYFLKEE